MPSAVAVGQDVNPAPHVVELGEEDVVPRRAEPDERLPLGRLEQHVEGALPFEERLEIGRDQCTGGIRLAADGPVGPQPEQQPLAVERGPGIVGLVDLD